MKSAAETGCGSRRIAEDDAAVGHALDARANACEFAEAGGGGSLKMREVLRMSFSSTPSQSWGGDHFKIGWLYDEVGGPSSGRC